MKSSTIIAVIIGGLMLAAVLNGGIYQIQTIQNGQYMAIFRLNRLTGTVTVSSTADHAWRSIDQENGMP